MINIPKDRFWSKVLKTETCWIWIGAKNNKGYGHLKVPRTRKNIHAHRLSWELHNGEIPNNLQVLHSCDNPACIRPDHLFLGTAKDNIQDCITKGRWRAGSKRLSIAVVDEIYHRKEESETTLAKEFGVSTASVSRIVTGKYWPRLKQFNIGKDANNEPLDL